METKEKLSTEQGTEARELEIWIDNTGKIYHQVTIPIYKSLLRKKKAGKYDSTKALKAFENLATEGAKHYCKEFGCTWHLVFSVETRREVARSILDYFETEEKAGNFTNLI